MHRAILIPLAAAAILGGTTTADAGFRFPDGQDRWEQRQMLNEEFRRAREVGGYNDPITALINLFSGTATERDIRPAVNSIRDVPGYGGFRLKGRWDD